MHTGTQEVVRRRSAVRPLMALAAVTGLLLAFWLGRRSAVPPVQMEYVGVPPSQQATNPTEGATEMWAHNLLLRKGPHFRIYLHWVRGQMVPSASSRIPSLDEPESFFLQIQKGVIDVRLADLTDYLNSGDKRSSTLKDLQVENNDGQLQIKAKAHKGLWLPVRVDGDLLPAPEGKIRFHLRKLNVLKLPMKGLFGLFHVELADLLPKEPIKGMQLSGDDILFDTVRLLPPPHARGAISDVKLDGDYIRILYGGAHGDDARMSQWHNFLQLNGGTISFGKLTMHNADLTLIDTSEDPWFDLDLTRYQTQLLYGTIKMTQRAGVEMYMPDFDHLPPDAGKIVQGVSVDWLRDRNTAAPKLEITDTSGGSKSR